MAIVITADQQDVYPPRVLVTVTGLVGGEQVAVYRSVAGVRTAVRAGADIVDDVVFLALDAELPFGVPVTYVATVDGVDYSTSAHTYVLTGGKVALSDAITGLAAEVVILAWPSRRYERQATVFKLANGSTVVVSGPAGQYAGQAELFVDSDVARAAVEALFADATANTIQVRQPGGYSGVDSYAVVLSHDVRRFSQDGSDPRRVIVVDLVEVDPWAADLQARGYTYADLADVYTGLTYADLTGDYATYLQLAQAELTP